MDIVDYKNLYFIGIKGSGMCALAMLLKKRGHTIIGSDVADIFYTDELLSNASIECYQGFSITNIEKNKSAIEAVIYSAAYTEENNAELRLASTLFPCMIYPKALGSISKSMPSCAIIGTHGKTTTAALTGVIMQSLNLPCSILAGSKVPDWDNTIWYGGDEFFVSEVCEYRNHFDNFYANYALYTSAELDHPDFFENEEAVYASFQNFLLNIDSPKKIIACGDSKGVLHTLDIIKTPCLYYGVHKNNDIQIIPHMRKNSIAKKGMQSFTIKGLSDVADALEWSIPIPGKALVLNTVGALVLVREWTNDTNHTIVWENVRNALATFGGVSRRCEVVYKTNDIILLDDYAHHPTAIKMTLEGIRNFYEPKRLIVDFMPHTYSRSIALLDEFAHSFAAVDVLIINDIYSSAREKALYNTTKTPFTGETFANAVRMHHNNTHYIPTFDDATTYITSILKKGDVVVSMGAGDNFRIIHNLKSKIEI